MRSLRWGGLVFSLLIVGVLGGLMAPLSSEAVPTLTIQVDGQATTSILTGTTVACGSSSYNACYNIRTNTTTLYTGTGGRKYTVQRADAGVAAKLRVGDFVGQDNFQLIGVKIVPVASTWSGATADQNTNESHEVKIVMQNAFNTNINVNNRGTYVFSLRTGGEFIAGPAGNSCLPQPAPNQADTTCDTINDRVTYAGVGTFDPTVAALTNANILRPSGTNSQVLSFTVAGPHADPILSFDGATNATMGQVNPTYPSFACDLDGAGAGTQCRPTITQTLTFTLKGQDTAVLTGTGDMFAANCEAQLSDKQEKQIAWLTKIVPLLRWIESRHHSPTLEQIIAQIEQFLATVNNNPDPACPGATLVNLEMAIAIAQDQIEFAEDNAVPAEPAPQTGTLVIRMYADVGSAEGVADFEATGNEMVPGIFSLDSTQTQAGKRTFTGLTTGVGGGAREVREIDFPINHENLGLSVWFLASVVCDGGDGQVTELYQGIEPEVLVGVRVNYVDNNQTLTCSFDNHHLHNNVPSEFHFSDGAHTTNIVEQDLVPPPVLQ